MYITLKKILKNYGKIRALNEVSLEVKEGELICLVGPSGCGKTTLLRIIAGLLPLDSGQIILNGTAIEQLPPQERQTALVFQNYALFPHLTVAENIAYGLKVRKISPSERERRVKEILNLVRLEGMESRPVQDLSGGQQQRVALARALVIEPKVILFDEPLSNLDEKLRISMRQEIKHIQQVRKFTGIYVTHDIAEALAIADRLVVMRAGEIQQIGLPDMVYHHPANLFVANFMGQVNKLSFPVRQHLSDGTLLDVWGRSIEIKHKTSLNEISCVLRPEDVYLGQGPWQAKVVAIQHQGALLKYSLAVGKQYFNAYMLNRRNQEDYKPGEVIPFGFNFDDVLFYLT